MLLEIDGKKVKEIRGERSLQDIADASGKAFSDVALLKWERGSMQPRKKNIKPLLDALGCSLEDITEEVDLNKINAN